MTRIFLLSDTHSYCDDRILHYASEADQTWHAGDIGSTAVSDAIEKVSSLKAVYGNIDDHLQRSQYPEDLIFQCENIKVLMTHIAGYPKRYHPRVRSLIEQHQPKLVICGHSHLLKVMNDKQYGHLHMNPGAAGTHGFHKVRTGLQFEIDNDQIKNLKVIEFGVRGAVNK